MSKNVLLNHTAKGSKIQCMRKPIKFNKDEPTTQLLMNSSSEINDLQEQLKILKNNLDNVNQQIQILNQQRKQLQQKYEQTKSQINKLHIQEISRSVNLSDHYDESEYYPWSTEVERVRKNIFKIDRFRPLQLRAINALLDGKDVILVMPTGAGKSLVYQLPALIDPNAFVQCNGQTMGSITLVISPLVSLMTDQSINLSRYGLNSNNFAILDSNTQLSDQRFILSQLAEKSNKSQSSRSNLHLLYVTPEKLAKSKLLLNRLELAYSLNRLARIAIDEIHCASQWGHDFRPDYKFLHVLKRQFPNLPVIGLTATASTEVIVDVQNMLGLNPEKCLVLRTSYNRANLIYEVQWSSGSVKNSVTFLANLINKRYPKLSGIIYCFSQKDTEDVATDLKQYGIKAEPYHANLNSEYKSKIHSSWVEGRIQVIVATVAFGMGIDKPDVRFVIHFSSSKSLENYYQESGRAGRDSKPADCVLIWRFSDLFRLASMVSSERTGLTKLNHMVSYCIELTKCRRYLIAQYLEDESWTADDCKDACDNCQRKNSSDSNILCLDVNSLLKETNNLLQNQSHTKQERVTGPKLVELMMATKSINSIGQKLLNITNKPDKEFYEYFITWCLVNNYLKLDFHYTPYSTICYVTLTNKQIRPELMPYRLHKPCQSDQKNSIRRSGSSETSLEMKIPRLSQSDEIDLSLIDSDD